jgi:hypothetical protein
MHIRRLGGRVWDRPEALDGPQNVPRSFVKPLGGLRMKLSSGESTSVFSAYRSIAVKRRAMTP